MKSFKVVVAILSIIVLILASCQQKPDLFKGTWIMVEGDYQGPDVRMSTTEENRICYKILSDGHFAVVEMCRAKPDSQFFAAVGRYSFDDSTFTETYDACNVGYKVGSSNRFSYKMEGDRWRLEMHTSEMKLNEVWIRKL